MNASDKPTGWELVLRTLQAEIDKLTKQIADHELQLECLKTCLKVYAKHGKKHPSSCGLGPSEEQLESDLVGFKFDLNRWQDALRLVKNAFSPQGAVKHQSRGHW